MLYYLQNTKISRGEQIIMEAYERLLNYVTILTPSDENSQTVPSSGCQFDLARVLEKEMKELGLTDVYLDDKCYLYGKLPATEGYESCPSIGFIAHMDTVSDFCDHQIRPILTGNYSGETLDLGNSGLVLDPNVFPHLSSLKGRTLITSDGTTILGADDKAGIAEILTMAERLINEEIPHGPISVAFTPDEEIGSGAEYFDIDRFGAQLLILWMVIQKVRFSLKTFMPVKLISRLLGLMYILVLPRIR